MSFFDDASLAFLPSGGAGKDGKAYSIKPTDGTGDFTFSRGSNLTATRVGPTGLIEKGYTNQSHYSNDFTPNHWVKASVNITANQQGYDGSNDAWLLTENSATSTHGIYDGDFVNGTGVQTHSIYLKSSGRDAQMRVFGIGSGQAYANFNLTSGTIGSSGGAILIDSNIESVGNGWYRCSITLNPTAAQGIGVYIVPNDTHPEAASYAGDSTSGLYIQDTQVNVGLVALPYIETASTTDAKAGLLENEPRFDYSGGATCPSLLLEPSRTNLVRSSEALINGSYGWTLGSATTLTLNDAISPEGVKNAFRLDIPTGNNTTLVRCNVLESTKYTFSFYVKRGTATELKYSVFNFSTLGNIVATTSYFSQTNTNDFVRIVVPFTTPVGCTDVGVYLDRDSGANGSAWFYGIQLEAGSYPTSYIPNHSGGIATRTGEDATANISSLINTSGSVAYFEGTIQDLTGATESFRDVFALTGAGGISLRIERRITNQYYIQRSSATINSGDDFNSYSDASMNDDTIKVAFKFSSTQLKLFYNGSLMQTFDGSYNFGFTDFKFRDGTTGNNIVNKNNQVLIFDTALSDADCISLTTL